MKEILVNILIVSYNHEKYIEQTINSVLSQKTNFKFKIILADDGSTDKTLEIVRQIETINPNKIQILESKKNKGVLSNSKKFLAVLNSKYFALLDGDDFWTYENKLQKQIDFLEENKEYEACFHDTNIIHIEEANEILFKNKEKYSQLYNYNKDVYPWDLLNRLIIPSSSLVLKTECLKNSELENYIIDNYSIEWKLTCFAIRSSKFYYINEVWSTYRNHPKGISKSNNIAFHQSHIVFLKNLLNEFYYKNIKPEVYEAISKEYKILIEKISNTNNKSLLRKTFYFYSINEIKRIFSLYKKHKK